MRYSRFSNTDLIDYQGQSTYGIWKKYNFLKEPLPSEQIGNFVVQANFAGRPDLISYYLYNTTLLDWVLLAFNNVRDPLNWPKNGDLIKYPIDSVVFQEIIG